MPEDDLPSEPSAEALANQMEEAYQDDEGGWQAPDREDPDPPESYGEEESSRYITAEDLDDRLNHLAETLLSHVGPGMRPQNDEADDPLGDAFAGDDYAREIAQRLAPVLREQIAGEMVHRIRPVAESAANSALYDGLSSEAADILWSTVNDPDNPIDPFFVAGNPTALRALRGMAQFEAAQAARTVAPRSDRTYMPSRAPLSPDGRGERDDLMRAFGNMPGFDPHRL